MVDRRLLHSALGGVLLLPGILGGPGCGEPQVIADSDDLIASEPAPAVPAWVQTARVGGLHVDREMNGLEVEQLLRERRAEHVSVLEIDTRLSDYLDDGAFAAEVQFLDRVARRANRLGMRSVVYFPSLEVLTPGGEHSDRTMAKEHEDWLQRGIDGAPNVFYGGKEVWVDEGAESAWMSPNSPYRDYFLRRIRQLAGTALSGVWIDVPVYNPTGSAWADTGPEANAAFTEWAESAGHGRIAPPRAVDFDDPEFRLWIRWRHENLADFIEEVRKTAVEVDPDFVVVAEVFPVDNVDGTMAGLDGTFRRSAENFTRVWEIDSVSNKTAMEYATPEDFTSKIAMYKWAAAADRENPPWSFVYGNKPLDAGLVMAAAVATRNLPFECKTPEMTETVGHDFRKRWFGFIAQHERELLRLRRSARLAVWYSSASRDYQDYPVGGGYGMYIHTDPPVDDPEWWATDEEDSAVAKPHLGDWRGAAYALSQLHIPYKVVTDPGDPAEQLAEVSFLWLPSVAAISDDSAQLIRDFVERGGLVLATGEPPGVLDELGNRRPASALADVFDLASDRPHPFGRGMALYRGDLRGREVFSVGRSRRRSATTLQRIEELVRGRVPEPVRIEGERNVHVEISRAHDGRQYLYLVNYDGLRQPVERAPVSFDLIYQAPEGQRVTGVEVSTPDEEGQRGQVGHQDLGDRRIRFRLQMDQFALVTLSLGPEN